ncbi:hypothetical protein SUGI_0919390 [Cryptomeria japonica]|uniref:nudix hydrolase 19, chloroplastic isoform X1 n=1 Tax=Cryptomeria japonica TaxID=3369 RepID=UPI002414982F|nr:nudix hydrolase 19, chloroplastic isoform X1 [Cryptomeria japonica]GLJ44084.1 hypothetical protein SUGI_0919390 [Cryptomeria japonica]
MATSSREHAFAGNPLIGTASTPTASSDIDSAVASIHMLWLNTAEDQLGHKILPFKQGKPLVVSTISSVDASQVLTWHLAWQSIYKCKESFQSSDVQLGEDLLVYLGQKDGVVYWALDFTETGQQSPLNGQGAYVELRTLMTATDLSDENSMAELSIAGHARALLEWHSLSQFCGKCGTTTLAIEAGRRRQCQNSNCKKRFYPRVDPVVIMLVIDKANDRALLSRQARFVPRMWSCLAGFIEPGESLEEAVRRETWEEVGIEVGEIVYHSSQPWPVGPSSMPCQLMVGFFAFAKTFNICVDKKELEEAKWHSREDVQKALTFAEYDKSQRKSAFRVHQICDGAEKGQSLFEDLNVETRELAPMFVPGPFAIAHHLISSWANKGVDLLES